MWPRQNWERELRSLLSRIEAAHEPRSDLVADILRHACPRLDVSPGLTERVRHLVEAKAWVDLGFWLIGWELPDWGVHRLSCDDRRWSCSVCIRGLAINWVEDIAEFQHGSPALALLGAYVQAQLTKAQGRGPSNVTIFRRLEQDRVTRPGPRPDVRD